MYCNVIGTQHQRMGSSGGGGVGDEGTRPLVPNGNETKAKAAVKVNPTNL